MNCQEIGGDILNQHTTEGEDYDVCFFMDGSACEAEALYDGECEEGSTPTFEDFCIEKGGQLISHDNRDEDEEWWGYMSCIFAGIWCDEDTYYLNDGCENEYRRSLAVNCQESGGDIRNRHTAEGEDYTVCIFEDGSACEAEALYDGECEEGSTPTFEDFCIEKGGQLISHDNRDEDEEPWGYMSCTFADDHTTCYEDTYYLDDGCENEYRRSRLNIRCIGLGLNDVDDMASLCAARDDMYTEPYECDDGRNACCTDSDLDNPSMPKFGGQCHRVVVSLCLHIAFLGL